MDIYTKKEIGRLNPLHKLISIESDTHGHMEVAKRKIYKYKLNRIIKCNTYNETNRPINSTTQTQVKFGGRSRMCRKRKKSL